VTSVTFSLASGAAGWNQVKQLEFSVPGVVSTPVPEAPGLVMVLLAICAQYLCMACNEFGAAHLTRPNPDFSEALLSTLSRYAV
jgi:hypothetical protein